MSDTTSLVVATTHRAADDAADDALVSARAGFDGIQRNPHEAERRLRAVLRMPDAEHAATVLAHWGLARLLHNAGELDEAVVNFEHAIALAASDGVAHDLAGIRISAALTFQTMGDAARALRELDLAAPSVVDPIFGRWAGQRALMLLNLGQVGDAIREFDRAVLHMPADDDPAALARTHLNRSVAHLQHGATDLARDDLVRAHRLAADAGEVVVAACALHNLGYLDGRLGDVPAALSSFELARAAYLRFGNSARLLASLDVDQCEVCLSVGLAPEALRIADQVIASLQRTGNLLQLGEARLLRARSLVMLGEHAAAATEAHEAGRLLAEHGRRPWAAFADYLGAVAATRSSTDHDAIALSARLHEVTASLDEHGWRSEAAEVRTVHGRLAIEWAERGPADRRPDSLDLARRLLATAGRRRRGATAALRAQASLARALLHRADGEHTAALTAAADGLTAVEEQRAALGATELRVAMSAAGVPLVDLALEITLERGNPASVLRWAERGRAVAMSVPLATPPDDPVLARALAELRELHLERRDGAGVDDRIGDAERNVLRLRRLDPGDPHHRRGLVSITELRAQLGRDVLVEYVEARGEIHAVVVGPRRSSLHRLGPAERVTAELDHLVFALRRLSLLPPGDRRVDAALRSLDQAAGAVDRLLLAPLDLDVADQPGPHAAPDAGIVIVPTGRLHLVPWRSLPSLARRACTVAPSATWWMRGGRPDAVRREGGGSVALVAGPRLQHATDELARLGEVHVGARIASGPAATVERTLDLLGDADLAHVAAHGTFRADSPMFSSLQLYDGPLNVHDLQRLRHVPSTVVLAACDAGRSGVLAGDELVGTAASLLAVGVRTIVAPLLPVSDASTATFAVALHRRLAMGEGAAAALAVVSAEARASGDASAIAVAASFLCVGCRPMASPNG